MQDSRWRVHVLNSHQQDSGAWSVSSSYIGKTFTYTGDLKSITGIIESSGYIPADLWREVIVTTDSDDTINIFDALSERPLLRISRAYDLE